MIKDVELELTDGRKVLITGFDTSKMYDVSEGTRTRLSFDKKFPFIRKEKRVITAFKYRTVYTTLNSICDAKYSVNCNLKQFCHIVGLDVNHWEMSIMESDLRGCG